MEGGPWPSSPEALRSAAMKALTRRVRADTLERSACPAEPPASGASRRTRTDEDPMFWGGQAGAVTGEEGLVTMCPGVVVAVRIGPRGP